MDKKILIADDDDVTIKQIKDALRRFNHTFVVAKDGKSARYKLRKGIFDLAFLDNFLPGAKGIDLVNEQKELRVEDRVPIIKDISGKPFHLFGVDIDHVNIRHAVLHAIKGDQGSVWRETRRVYCVESWMKRCQDVPALSISYIDNVFLTRLCRKSDP